MSVLSNTAQNNLQDKYEDLVFEAIIAYYVQDEYERIKSSCEKVENTSSVEKLYDRQERKQNFREIKKFVKSATQGLAMVVFVIVISVAASVYAFAEVRVAVAEVLYHIITEEKELYTEVSIGEATGFIDPELYDWEGAYAPTYMPKGYEFKEKVEFDNEVVVSYHDGTKYITFSQSYRCNTVQVNTEDYNIIKTFQVGNSKAFLLFNHGNYGVYWNRGKTFFRVEGNASEEELILIAESIKILR